MILLDTSVLIDSLTGPMRSGPLLLRMIDRGERVLLPSIALYEWLRGPRTGAELEVQAQMLPAAATVPFGAEEAAVAALLSRTVRRVLPVSLRKPV